MIKWCISSASCSDWIHALSADATGSFLRAAELGAAIEEQWVLTNSAIYLWNYNNHLLAAGEYRVLLPTFQKLLGMLQKSEDTRYVDSSTDWT